VESLSRAKYKKIIDRKIFIWKRANMEAMRLDMTKFARFQIKILRSIIFITAKRKNTKGQTKIYKTYT
jgi:hypothetical protein